MKHMEFDALIENLLHPSLVLLLECLVRFRG